MTDQDLKDRIDKMERERAEIDARNGWEDVDLTDDSIDDSEDDELDYTMVLNPDGTRTKIPRVKHSERKISARLTNGVMRNENFVHEK